MPYAKLDNPQSLNLYAYVGNNPLSSADADGHTYLLDRLLVAHLDSFEIGEFFNFRTLEMWGKNESATATLQNDQKGQQKSVQMSTSTYKTVTKAATAALDAIIGQSEKSGWEYAGQVVKLHDGRYAYTSPTTIQSNDQSDFDGGMPEGTRIPAETTDAGMYHTHPTCSDCNPDGFSGADNAIAVREHMPSYIESGSTRSIYLLDGSRRTSILDPTPPIVIRYSPPQ